MGTVTPTLQLETCGEEHLAALKNVGVEKHHTCVFPATLGRTSYDPPPNQNQALKMVFPYYAIIKTKHFESRNGVYFCFIFVFLC